jgi:hypothetical protein
VIDFFRQPLSSSSSGVLALSSTHWSQLEPLSSNKVSNRGGAVNAADDDMIDEAAERLAFMEAVSQWRQQGSSSSDQATDSNRSKMKIEREYEQKSAVSGEKTCALAGETHGSLWHNPFGAPAAAAAEDKRGPSSSSLLVVDDSDNDEDDVKASKGKPTSSAMPRVGPSRFDGPLDEAKEHEVCEWRPDE